MREDEATCVGTGTLPVASGEGRLVSEVLRDEDVEDDFGECFGVGSCGGAGAG